MKKLDLMKNIFTEVFNKDKDIIKSKRYTFGNVEPSIEFLIEQKEEQGRKPEIDLKISDYSSFA